MPNSVDPIERVCRALCQFHGNPTNAQFDGNPMWEAYRDEAMAILWVLREDDWLPNGLVVRKDKRRSV